MAYIITTEENYRIANKILLMYTSVIIKKILYVMIKENI